MPIFIPKAHHVFICTFDSTRKNQNETDRTLYYDNQTRRFFVVKQTEGVSGPRVSGDFTEIDITEDEARSIVSNNPESLEKANPFFAGS